MGRGRETEREREREREREMDLLFHLFMHSLVVSCVCPNWGSNPQPWDDAITNYLARALV